MCDNPPLVWWFQTNEFTQACSNLWQLNHCKNGGKLVAIWFTSASYLAPIGWDDPINRFMDFFVLAGYQFTTLKSCSVFTMVKNPGENFRGLNYWSTLKPSLKRPCVGAKQRQDEDQRAHCPWPSIGGATGWWVDVAPAKRRWDQPWILSKSFLFLFVDWSKKRAWIELGVSENVVYP